MEFKVGQISARCPKCQGSVFEEEGRRGRTQYSCAACGTEVSYAELIVQIGRQSASRARQRLSASKVDESGLKALITGRGA